MALITCPECKNKISSTASSCPKCGYKINTARYGTELGKGIKEGLKGLNTVASPKSRKMCVKLIVIPFILTLVFTIAGAATQNDTIIGMILIPALCMGFYQFYVGKFKMGLIYTFTMGGLFVGCLIDLFKLTVTKTFKDSNGFPLIY